MNDAPAHDAQPESELMQSRNGASVDALIRCPACRSALERLEAEYLCAGGECGRRFPVVDGVPVLIDDQHSVFSTSDYSPARDQPVASPGPGRFLPKRGITPRSEANFAQFEQLLLEATERPAVLVVGGQIAGKHMDALLANPRISFVETDVTIGRRTRIVCDGHRLPFVDGSFDGVVIQAVLEHVLDPHQCVEEIHRVLKPNGLVYAETPFMQQVHAAQFDFTRFTALGHPRLFRRFDEVASGACGGPATAFVWSYEYLLSCLPRSQRGRQAATAVARLTSSWIKHLGRALIDRPAALDAAAGVFFLGRRSNRTLSDRDLVAQYRGAQHAAVDYPVL